MYAGEEKELDVFVDAADDLGGYQVTLAVTASDSENLDLTGLFILDTRPDSALFGVTTTTATSIITVELAAANLGGGGIPVGGRRF